MIPDCDWFDMLVMHDEHWEDGCPGVDADWIYEVLLWVAMRDELTEAEEVFMDTYEGVKNELG